MNVQIGADELILWLRKNGKRENESNLLLGKNIHDLIVDRLNGVLIQRDVPCIWDTNNEEIVHELFLPQTAAQYTINTKNLVELFNVLQTW